jgi:hypothetical protein
MITRFIVWYLKKKHGTIEYNGFVVRVFTKDWYYENVLGVRK